MSHMQPPPPHLPLPLPKQFIKLLSVLTLARWKLSVCLWKNNILDKHWEIVHTQWKKKVVGGEIFTVITQKRETRGGGATSSAHQLSFNNQPIHLSVSPLVTHRICQRLLCSRLASVWAMCLWPLWETWSCAPHTPTLHSPLPFKKQMKKTKTKHKHWFTEYYTQGSAQVCASHCVLARNKRAWKDV